MFCDSLYKFYLPTWKLVGKNALTSYCAESWVHSLKYDIYGVALSFAIILLCFYISKEYDYLDRTKLQPSILNFLNNEKPLAHLE